MQRLMVIGAGGAIGKVLTRLLEQAGAEVVRVGRSTEGDMISFEAARREAPGGFSLIVDASSGSLNSYLQLVQWLNVPGAPELVHFSSVRVDVADERDGYALYKRGVLMLLRAIAGRVWVIKGDLFSFENRLLGYWRFVDDIRRWKVVASREVDVAAVERIATILLDMARRAPDLHMERLEFATLEVNTAKCKVIRVSRAWIAWLFRLRVNAVLRFLRCCVVP